jgi:hypothetical protein
MKRGIPPLVAAALLLGDAFAPAASAGVMTYYLQSYPADQNGASLYGTILTDGKIGALSPSDILGGSLKLASSGIGVYSTTDVTIGDNFQGLSATSDGNLGPCCA